jgi:hemolysin activation/secretion protein
MRRFYKIIVRLIFAQSFVCLALSDLVAAQLPPIVPTRPTFPVPKQPADIPIEIVPSPPLINDALPSVTLNSIRFVGNTVFNDVQLTNQIQSFVGKTISQSELQKITAEIKQYYIDNGYIKSDAVYQASDNESLDPNNAVITIRAIEGQLGTVNLIGPPQLHSYIRQRIHRLKVLDYKSLLTDLRRLNADPLIKELDVKIVPSTDSVNLNNLQIRFKAAKPYQVSLFANNYRNPGIGAFERGIEFHARNFSFSGDDLSLIWSNTNGSNAVAANYTVPILKDNTTISFLYSYGSSQVIAEPFSPLNIIGTSQSIGFVLNHPVLRHFADKSSTEITLGFGLEHYQSQDKLLDTNFPISLGSNNDGSLKTTVFSFSQELKYTRPNDAYLLSSKFRIGLDIGSVTSPLFDNGQFFSWRGDALYVHNFKQGFQLLARTTVQLSDRSLVFSEQYPIGGFLTLRGYPQYFVLADNGVLVSTEFRIPLYQGKKSNLSLNPFMDAAYVWNNSQLSSPSLFAASAGLYFQYNFSDRFSLNLSWAHPLIDAGGVSSGLDNSRILFGLRVDLF